MASSSRPVQRVNYTGCQAGLNLNEQVDGSWKIGLKVVLEHNHEIGPEYYGAYGFSKKLTDEDIELVLLLDKANAPGRKIADTLSQKTGDSYNTKDIKNLIKKYKSKEKCNDTLEKHLDEVRRNGGTVRVEKDVNTGYVKVLWIQPKEMKDMVARVKPTVFQNDTTFGTNCQGYKLFIPVYHNNITNKSEFSGLLFLITETKGNIETGLQFFKDSVDYTRQKLIFFVDKAPFLESHNYFLCVRVCCLLYTSPSPRD